jgi:hypothetical protein
MRILNISSGIAVLFTTLAYAHILHHHLMHASPDDHHSPLFWLAIFLALAAGILSLIGALLLLKRPTTSPPN